MDTPTVSVIVPVYNCEAYVKDAIESVICQTFTSIEIIAVDDGSTDNSIEILKSFSDTRLKIICQENSGAATARNRGVKEAKGKYLAFLDADDLWVPDKIRLQLDAIQKNNAPDIIFGHITEFLNSDFNNNNYLPIPGYSTITIFVSKEKFIQVGWLDPQWTVAEFIDWFDRAKSCGLTYLMLPDILAYRRIHSGNLNKFKRKNVKHYASVLKASLNRRRGFN